MVVKSVTPIPAQVPMGKGGEMKTVDILPDFEDQPVPYACSYGISLQCSRK